MVTDVLAGLTKASRIVFRDIFSVSSSLQGSNMASPRVGGPGSTFAVLSRNEHNSIVLDVGSEGGCSTAQKESPGSDTGLNLVRTNQSQSHSVMHIQGGDNLANHGYAAHTGDGYTDNSYTNGEYIGAPWQRVPMLIDGHKPQAIVFRPSCPIDDGNEAVLGKNLRKASQAASIEDYGSYSGIVRVKAIYEDLTGAVPVKRSFWGTGIIIDPQHVMTVAHNAWHMEFGPAIAITIHRDHRADPSSVDHHRHVEIASVHYSWTTTHSKRNDFAVLRVSRPFSGRIKPMKYMTSVKKPVEATVHGFSSDFPKRRILSLNFHRRGILSYSRAKSRFVTKDGLIFHNADTFRGASGGPIVDSKGVVIAVHRGWGRHSSVKGRINQAVAINCYGNDVDNFIAGLALGAGKPPIGIACGATFVFQAAQVTLLGWD